MGGTKTSINQRPMEQRIGRKKGEDRVGGTSDIKRKVLLFGGGQERNEKSKMEMSKGEITGKSSRQQSTNEPMKQRWWEKERQRLGGRNGRYGSKCVVVVVVEKNGTKNRKGKSEGRNQREVEPMVVLTKRVLRWQSCWLTGAVQWPFATSKLRNRHTDPCNAFAA